jgi:hypothetical protein
MPTSSFFNNYNSELEQSLVESLVHEAINIMGFDGYYIPNDNEINRDLLYGEDPLKTFTTSYSVELYLSNSVDPGMNNDFFSKFGLEIKNNVRVLLSRRAFSEVPQTRPKEGHLIYIPFLSGTGELYEIKFVNDAQDFFTLGRKQPYNWELELELFKYSHEEIYTGIEEIDVVNEVDSYAIEYSMSTGSGIYEAKEIVYQGPDLANSLCRATVQFWNEQTNILKVTNIIGEFNVNTSIIGATSGASYNLSTYDALNNPQYRDAWDNKVVELESDVIIDNTESNPFGNL